MLMDSLLTVITPALTYDLTTLEVAGLVGPRHLGVGVDPEAELADQVQLAQGGVANSRDITGIGGNLRLHQHDVERAGHGARA